MIRVGREEENAPLFVVSYIRSWQDRLGFFYTLMATGDGNWEGVIYDTPENRLLAESVTKHVCAYLTLKWEREGRTKDSINLLCRGSFTQDSIEDAENNAWWNELTQTVELERDTEYLEDIDDELQKAEWNTGRKAVFSNLPTRMSVTSANRFTVGDIQSIDGNEGESVSVHTDMSDAAIERMEATRRAKATVSYTETDSITETSSVFDAHAVEERREKEKTVETKTSGMDMESDQESEDADLPAYDPGLEGQVQASKKWGQKEIQGIQTRLRFEELSEDDEVEDPQMGEDSGGSGRTVPTLGEDIVMEGEDDSPKEGQGSVAVSDLSNRIADVNVGVDLPETPHMAVPPPPGSFSKPTVKMKRGVVAARKG